MEREYKTIKTPKSGQEVVLKAWVTGGEKRVIQNTLLNDSVVSNKDIQVSGNKFNVYQDKAIETVVVSIGGVKENLAKIWLDMPSEDYSFLWKIIEGVLSDGEENKKK